MGKFTKGQRRALRWFIIASVIITFGAGPLFLLSDIMRFLGNLINWFGIGG